MSVRKTLPVSAAAYRFIVAHLLVLSFYNPSSISVVRLLGHQEIAPALRLVLGAGYAMALLVVARQAWCGLRSMGAIVSGLIASGLLAATVSIAGATLETSAGPTLAGLVFVSLLLGTGQVATFYTRQLSGQSGVLKSPP